MKIDTKNVSFPANQNKFWQSKFDPKLVELRKTTLQSYLRLIFSNKKLRELPSAKELIK